MFHASLAQVVSIDAKSGQLTCIFPSGQISAAPVKFGYHGAADGLRLHQPALPGRGTWGLVIFPGGDVRAGIWVCSVYSSFLDARSTESDPFLDYHSHWSGYFDMLNSPGEYAQSFPDGSYFVVSGSTAKPNTFRHIVDQTQTQQFVPLTDAQRVPNPPPARHIYWHHASGTTQHIDPTGNVTVTGNSAATLEQIFGGTTSKIDNHGNTTITGAGGAIFDASFNSGQLEITNAGGILANAAAGQMVQFSIGGGSPTFTIVRTDLLVNWLANHTHSGVQAGGSDTGVPVQTISNSTIQSTTVNVSQ